jgi:hypothetical protein
MTLVKNKLTKRDLKSIQIRNGQLHKNFKHLKKIYWPYLPIIIIIGLILTIASRYQIFSKNLNHNTSLGTASLNRFSNNIFIDLAIIVLALLLVILVISRFSRFKKK